MTFQAFIFYFFSAILIFAALGIITARNPVHAVLCMVLCFFTSAGLWIQLQAEFLALVLVLGFVAALFVFFFFFGVISLNRTRGGLREGYWSYLPLGGLVALLLVAEMALVLWGNYTAFGGVEAPAPLPQDYSNTKELGRLLYTDYVYPFEIAAVILLVAIVAAIALTPRQRKTSKYQDPSQQINIRRADRVRIVSMPAEKTGETPGERGET